MVSMDQCWKNAFKYLTVVVIALYIKLWFTKTDDNYYDEMAKENYSDSEHNAKRITKEYLTVVTYNMWCNYLIKGKPNYVDRFEGLANGVKNADIVFVQEIFILRVGPLEFSNCATAMVEVMRSKGFVYKTSITASVPYLLGQSSGVAIFSKIPLKTTTSEVFKHAGIKERVNNKGFVSAEFEINNSRVALFTIHTDAHVEDIRALQLKQLTSAVEKHKNSFVIVGGDFNINPHNSPQLISNKEEYENLLKTMSSVGLKSAFPNCERTHEDGACYDYLFVSSNVKVLEKRVINLLTNKGEMVSDHFGLFMKIKLQNN